MASCHDCADGGLGVALAETAFAGALGMDVDLGLVPDRDVTRDDHLLFSETPSRFVATVSPENRQAFETALEGCAFGCIGAVRSDGILKVKGRSGGTLLEEDIGALKAAGSAAPFLIRDRIRTRHEKHLGKGIQGMAKPVRSIVITGNGTNCEREMAHACRLAGSDVTDIVHISELLCGEKKLDDYDFLNLPGGFLDGDDLGSAKAGANRILHAPVRGTKEKLFDQFDRFIRAGKLILGVCNGSSSR